MRQSPRWELDSTGRASSELEDQHPCPAGGRDCCGWELPPSLLCHRLVSWHGSPSPSDNSGQARSDQPFTPVNQPSWFARSGLGSAHKQRSAAEAGGQQPLAAGCDRQPSAATASTGTAGSPRGHLLQLNYVWSSMGDRQPGQLVLFPSPTSPTLYHPGKQPLLASTQHWKGSSFAFRPFLLLQQCE